MKGWTLVLALVGLLAVTASARAELYDVTASFSTTNGNPNGAWSYGWVNNNAFQSYALTSQADAVGYLAWYGPLVQSGNEYPVIWKNVSLPTIYGVATGQLALQCGPGGEMSAARWSDIAGFSGNAVVDGQFLAGDSGIPLVGIFKNGDWGSPIWTSANSGTFHLSVPVTPGDTLTFGVYSGFSAGTTPLLATVTTPEPATIVLLGVAIAGLLVRAWRRRAG